MERSGKPCGCQEGCTEEVTLEAGFEGRIEVEQEVVNRNHLTRKTFKKCMEEM